MAEPISSAAERRRLERRTNPTLAELTLPELRRMMVTTVLFVVIVVLFLFMVKSVIIAAILGIIVATAHASGVSVDPRAHAEPGRCFDDHAWRILIVPAAALTVYSYEEIADVATYVNVHQDEIAHPHRRLAASSSVPRQREHELRREALRRRCVELRHQGARLAARCVGDDRHRRDDLRVHSVLRARRRRRHHGLPPRAEFRRGTESCRPRSRRTCEACCTAPSIRRF